MVPKDGICVPTLPHLIQKALENYKNTWETPISSIVIKYIIKSYLI